MDPEAKEIDVSHVEDNSAGFNPSWAASTLHAQNATDTEHSLTVRQALRIYPTALGWSVGVSTAIIMLGYDTALLSTFFAFPSFQQKYGEAYGDGYQLSSRWQAALSNSTTVGVIIGLLIVGWLVDKYGYRRISMVSYVLMTGFIFIPFFAPNVQVLLVGEILCGLPWGVFNILGPAYASEVMPVVLRGYLTSYVNLCWVIGQFISAGVLNGLVHRTDQWGYRLPFAVQWVWPVPLFCIMVFAPESPWWLVRKNRPEEAERSLKRLSRADANVDVKATVAMLIHTDDHEREISSGTTYLDCFKGPDLRRTEICTVVFCIQAASGLLFAQYCTYFMEQAGLDAADAFKMNLGYNGLAFLGTVLSWFLMKRLGRRTIYVGGLAILTTIMFLVGLISLAPVSNVRAMWAQSAFMLVWIFFYDLTIGPLAFAIASETSSTRLRGKSLAIARAVENCVSIVAQTINPYMLNPSEGNWKGRAAFFWGTASLVCFIWAYFRLPECKGRTYEELDILFENRIPARKFKKYVVDAYSSSQVLVAKDEIVNENKVE
jgi:SP family general alpha glucoside:H+ symporter-like MFS transporter